MKHGLPFLVVLAGILVSGQALAHAESPLARKVVGFDDGSWLLRTNFGIISSDAPDQFVCEEAFLGGDRFFVAPLGTTSYVTFGETSIHATSDGCEFERVGDISGRVEDVDSYPASGAVTYISNGEEAGVFVSTDAGQSFAALGAIDTDTFQLTTVRFYSDSTLIVGAYNREADGAAAIFSVDVGTGEATDLPLPDGLSYPYVIAAGADRLVFNARSMVQTVFVGTLAEPAKHPRPQQDGESWPTGAAVSPDGSRIYLAGMVLGRGIIAAEWNETELVWESEIDAEPAGCIDHTNDQVRVCSSVAAGGDADLVSLSAGASAPIVTFSEIVGPRESCPADSDVGTVCPLVWPEVAPALGVQVEGAPDAGVTSESDAGTDSTTTSGDSTCATVGGSPGLVTLLALIIAGRIRRRKDP